jgi:GMP synthase-like glutamine amidotransferase
MRIHVLKHVDFEGPAAIGDWAADRGHDLAATGLFAGEALPSLDDVGLLAVMGGPMGVHDNDEHPWLEPEREFLAAVLEAGKPVLGVCLGAQLLAQVLGAAVGANPHPEVGFFGVDKLPESECAPVSGLFPEAFTPLHWHNDTFAIPPGAVPLASSAGCANQGFIRGSGDFSAAVVVGLQFHIESTPESIEALIANCPADCGPDAARQLYVQPPDEIRKGFGHLQTCHRILWNLLDAMTGSGS